jgi:antitoxin (DNA-binding transcriptional repressor) of toxin-antitoxin stability system
MRYYGPPTERTRQFLYTQSQAKRQPHMTARRVSIREARQRLHNLLEQVQAGHEEVVLRRGVDVGRLVRPEQTGEPLPDLSGLRASVKSRASR